MRPMPTLTQRLAAAATILLALAIAAVLLLRSLGVPLALGPLATAAPSLAEPTPLASDGGDPGAAFSRIESQVRAIRGLAAPDIGPPDILSRDQLAAELRRIFEAEYPAPPRKPALPAIEAMLTMTPPPSVFMRGTTAREQRKTPRRLVPIISSN